MLYGVPKAVPALPPHQVGDRLAAASRYSTRRLRVLLSQRGVSTAVTQRLLEHSSPQLTNDVYTNVDPVLRQAIGLLPVSDWL